MNFSKQDFFKKYQSINSRKPMASCLSLRITGGWNNDVQLSEMNNTGIGFLTRKFCVAYV